ncbi:MAG: hypothetical protein AAGA85_23190, partial [Bacteroidota bacterium]
RNLYFLVPAVLAIWGIVIYRIVDFSGEEQLVINQRPPSLVIAPEEGEVYEPDLNYPDPFLKRSGRRGASRTTAVRDRSIAQPRPSQVQPADPVVQLDIVYNGFIVAEQGGARIALLKIEGRETLLTEGQDYQGHRLFYIGEDSVGLIIDGDRRYIQQGQVDP